jgi:hypothetical protein
LGYVPDVPITPGDIWDLCCLTDFFVAGFRRRTKSLSLYPSLSLSLSLSLSFSLSLSLSFQTLSLSLSFSLFPLSLSLSLSLPLQWKISRRSRREGEMVLTYAGKELL